MCTQTCQAQPADLRAKPVQPADVGIKPIQLIWDSWTESSMHLVRRHTLRVAGSFDHFLNFQIAFIILMQISMCLFCAVASYIWREQYGDRRYFLGLTQYTQV